MLTNNVRGYIYIVSTRRTQPFRLAEHRIVLEEALGRRIAHCEEVHHINGVRDDNRLENLLLCVRKEHVALDRRNDWRRGQHHSEETRAKMRAHHKSRGGLAGRVLENELLAASKASLQKEE
jgi:hypothetical protein